MNNHDYLFVRLWHSRSGSYGTYISMRVAEAKHDKPEFDAIYKRSDYSDAGAGDWVLLRDIENLPLRESLIDRWQQQTGEKFPRELLKHRLPIAKDVTHKQSGQDVVIRGTVEGFGNFAGYSVRSLKSLLECLTDDRGITVRGGNDHYVINWTNGDWTFFDGDVDRPIIQLIIDGHVIRLDELAKARRKWLLNPVP